MARYINADTLEYTNTGYIAKWKVDMSPTLDLVPAPVSCGKCEFYEFESGCCLWLAFHTNNDFYCAHGKLREMQRNSKKCWFPLKSLITERGCENNKQ